MDEPASPQLDATIAEYMLVRLRNASIAALVGVGTGLIVFAVERSFVVVAASAVSFLVSLGMLLAIRAGRLHPRRAGLATFCLWATVSLSSAITWIVHGPYASVWLVITFVGYSAVQLERAWFWSALGLGGVAWVVGTSFEAPQFFHYGLVTLAGTVALGLLTYRTGRTFVLRVERLHGEEQRRAAELAAALADARREIEEREQVEADREKVREQFVAAQRMEAVGTLASGVAHDMNNVLAGIQGVAEVMLECDPGSARADLETIVSSCQRGAKLTRGLLAFARHERLRREPTDLATIAGEVVAILERTVPKSVRVRLDVTDRPTVDGDPTHLTQALLNVCLNGIDAMGERGALTLSVRRATLDGDKAHRLDLPAGAYGVLEVRDEGRGMDEATRRKIFEPFFTTKPKGKGTGLGLSMVYGTIKAHDGAVSVRSSPGAGATFELYFPVSAAAVEAESEPVLPSDAAPSHGRVLVVDDEAVVRTATKRLLEAEGHAVLLAENGADALAVFAREQGVDLVVLDIAMPVMSGAECLRRLRELEPKLKVVVVTGFADCGEAASIRDLGPNALLEKPVPATQLASTVARLLRPSRARAEGLVEGG